MSFLAMQTAIARICVDHAFRQSFLRDPDGALTSCGLTADESEAVKALDLKVIQEYADSLVGKKMALVTKWFPLSLAALRRALPASRVRRLVFSYGYQRAGDTGELGGEWVRGEFVRFKDYLQDQVSTGEIPIPFFTDVLEFEAARQMMSHDPAASTSAREPASEAAAGVFDDAARNAVKPLRAAHVSLRRFTCDIFALISAIENGRDQRDPGGRGTDVGHVREKARHVESRRADDQPAVEGPARAL